MSIYVPTALLNDHLEQEEGLRRFLSFRRDGLLHISPTDRYLFVCFTNRCGSDLLSQALASTGRLPESLEPFNVDTTRHVCELNGLPTYESYFTFTVRQYGRHGCFCAKVALGQLLLLNAAGLLEDILPRCGFILLERNDKIAQAISRRIAWQTGRWTSQQSCAVEDDAVLYDRLAIDRDIAAINWQVAGFRLLFNANGITPIHISYEGLVADLEETVGHIGERLGLSQFVADRSRIVVRKLDNRLNESWRRRYLAGD